MRLPDQRLSPDAVRRFLRDLGRLPPDMMRRLPVLTDMALLVPGGNHAAPIPKSGAPSAGLLLGRLERRYRRICFVQRELERLDFSQTRPGIAFDDLVLEQADFSMYRSLSAEEFSLFSGPGLEDYEDGFFQSTFELRRKAVAGIIGGAYDREARAEGPRFQLRDERFLRNPLFLSIMRSLHSSLDFVPLFSREEIDGEWRALHRALDACAVNAAGFSQFLSILIPALDGGGMVHRDGMRTEFSVQGESLQGVFHPENKAYTMILLRSSEWIG